MNLLQKKTHNNFKLLFLNSKQLLKFGKFGIKVCSNLNISKTQLDSFYFILLRKIKLTELKKKVKIWNLLYLNQTVTSFSLESRMGKGKGNIQNLSVFIQKGSIIFEFDNLTKNKMKKIFIYFKSKISGKIKLIEKI